MIGPRRFARHLSVFLLFGSACAASPGSRSEDLRRDWTAIASRAARLCADSEIAGMATGGVLRARGSVFAKLASAAESAPEGAFFILESAAGLPVAWSGQAPTYLPTTRFRGAIWSAESVLFFDQETYRAGAGHLAFGRRLPRRWHRIVFSPRGDPWSKDRDVGTWGGYEAAGRMASDTTGRASGGVGAISFLGIGLIALLAVSFRRPRGPVGRTMLAAAFLAAGTVGLVVCGNGSASLDPAWYLRQPVALTAFTILTVAAAAAVSGDGDSRFRFLALGPAAGFITGALGASSVWGVTAGFGLTLAGFAMAAVRRPPIRQAILLAAIGAGALFGPLLLWTQEQERRREYRAADAVRRRLPDSRVVLQSAAGAIGGVLRQVSFLFEGAGAQDLSDLAFSAWRRSVLSAAPVSGIRLWHDGRLVSRFAFGIPPEEPTSVRIGSRQVAVERILVTLPALTFFPPGEEPDTAELSAADWPVGRALPVPDQQYRELLFRGARAGATIPTPPPGTPRRFAAAFVAGIVAFAGALLVGSALELVRSLRHRRWRNLWPKTFRGRITAMFTLLVLVPFAAVTIFIRAVLGTRVREETALHARTALVTARTVLDDYLFAAGSSPGRRQLINDDLLDWMARVVGHDLSIYVDGRLLSTSRRELFSSGLLPERLSGATLSRLLDSPSGVIVGRSAVSGHPFDEVDALLGSLPGGASAGGPAVIAIPLIPEQRETELEISRLSASLAAFSLLVFGVAVVVGTRTAYLISGPIADLVAATRVVAEGGSPDLKPATDPELERLVGAFREMAETLARQRRELARAGRLEAWAEMGKIIAHEIKNPLTPIQLSAEHLWALWKKGGPDFGRQLQECVDNILRQTAVLRGIASEFSDYARLPQPAFQKVAVEVPVREVEAAFSGAGNIAFDVDVGDLKIDADAKLVVRALTNLVVNAREAIGRHDGTIRILARRRDGRVVVRVEDDGPGAPPENLARLFEPYFSSKTSGTGLGLSIVRRIAEEHGGAVRAENLASGGFAVEIDFAEADGVGSPA